MGESSAASKDPFHFPVKPAANATQPESFNVGLTELAQLARQAFEEKRRKQSLALANAILKIDPEDKQAVVIRSWIEADLQNDLKTASALADEGRAKNNLAFFERAEVSLRTILNIDAENEPARALLNEITVAQGALVKSGPAEVEEVQLQPGESMIALPLPSQKSRGRRWAVLVVPALLIVLVLFVMRNRYELSASQEQDVRNATVAAASNTEADATTNAGSLEIFVIPPSGVQLAVDDSAARPAPRTIDLKAGEHRLLFTAAGYAPQTISKTITAGQRYVLPIVMERPLDAGGSGSQPAQTPPPKSTPPSSAKAAPQAAPNPLPSRPPEAPKAAVVEPPKVAAPLGSLAINAAVPVDVYISGNHLGVTPLTLQLPSGAQTLEYRYQGLQKMVSHTLKPGETTVAAIAFDVTLQINARPWAQVSIEGTARELGQTPLSNVTAPVGSVLVFQNPSFPEKKYRVTGKDSTVQIVFP